MATDLRQIIEDIASFKERTGRFPKRDEKDPPREGETWTGYEQTLRRAYGMTLRGLLDAEFGALNTRKRRLTLSLVQRRGREHHGRHGVWPTRDSGQVEGEPEGETWLRWEGAVQQGLRGLAKQPSLAYVFTGGEADAANRTISRAKGRSVEGVVELIREFNERTGSWPTETTQDQHLEQEHGESWRKLDRWLAAHHQTTLVKLAAERLGARNTNRPGVLDLKRLVREVRSFKRANGRWPTKDDGPIAGWSGEAWGNVHKALSTGGRGTADTLPEPMTLKAFVDRYCDLKRLVERLPGEGP